MRPTAWQRLDHLQPLLAGMLVVLGLMTVYSAHAEWVRQLVWVALGAAAYTAAAAVDYRRVDTLAPWLYLAMAGMLPAVRLLGRPAPGAPPLPSTRGMPVEPAAPAMHEP